MIPSTIDHSRRMFWNGFGIGFFIGVALMAAIYSLALVPLWLVTH